MKTADYRPLSALLNEQNRPKMEDIPRERPTAAQMTGLDEAGLAARELQKQARQKYVDMCQEGAATYDGLTIRYRLYVPENMEPGVKYPMIVFLHGGSECGDDNRIQMVGNNGAEVWIQDQLDGVGEKCFVLSPQCPSSGMGWLQDRLLAVSTAMDEIIETYPVDEQRLYVTGASMGGGGSWRMNCLFPARFAAVVPMCPAACMAQFRTVIPEAIEEVANALVDKPLWIFHAADDKVVTVETSRSLVRALEAKGKVCGKDFYYTEYSAELGYNHSCSLPSYGNKAMREWLFQQKL